MSRRSRALGRVRPSPRTGRTRHSLRSLVHVFGRRGTALALLAFGVGFFAYGIARAAPAARSAAPGASVSAATAAAKPQPPPPVGDAGPASADAGALAADAAAPARADQGGNAFGTCVEHVAGKARPEMVESLPAQGLAGHVTTLQVVVHHGKGETVLPTGFHLRLGSAAERALERAGFALPDPDGGAGPSLKVATKGDSATTTVRIPFVALPQKAGRQVMTLPPVPISIARASGDVITLCTKPHRIVIDDPTANTPHAKPRQNPRPRPQRELWETAKRITYVALIALIVGAFVAWLIGKWLKREKPVPPPPPPRPPWEVALEELFDIRHAGLVHGQRFREHFERVSYSVRKYLGNRYGFDGLESTTHEVLGVLKRVVPPVTVIGDIQSFLRQADLVKFARLTPTGEECEGLLEAGEHIVRQTIPPPYVPGGAAPAPEPPPWPPSGEDASGRSQWAPPETPAPRPPWAPPQGAEAPEQPAPRPPWEPPEGEPAALPEGAEPPGEPAAPPAPVRPELGEPAGEPKAPGAEPPDKSESEPPKEGDA